MMKLENHLQQLPKHSLENDLWAKIDQQLDLAPSIANKLPQHKADSDLWYRIEDELNKQGSPYRLLIRRLSVAASIAIIITLGTVYLTKQNTPDQIYFTEEVYIQEVSSQQPQLQGLDVLENCNSFPAVCSTPDFTRLKSNLDRLKLEEQKLRKLKQTVNDPKMELYHARIVKNIQQVEAEMLQMFI